MTDRKAKLSDFLDQMLAAATNCRVEYRAHGESGALRGFVEVLETAILGLHHLLGEAKLTSEQETKAAKIFALKQDIESASKKTVDKTKELAELMEGKK